MKFASRLGRLHNLCIEICFLRIASTKSFIEICFPHTAYVNTCFSDVLIICLCQVHRYRGGTFARHKPSCRWPAFAHKILSCKVCGNFKGCHLSRQDLIFISCTRGPPSSMTKGSNMHLACSLCICILGSKRLKGRQSTSTRRRMKLLGKLASLMFLSFAYVKHTVIVVEPSHATSDLADGRPSLIRFYHARCVAISKAAI